MIFGLNMNKVVIGIAALTSMLIIALIVNTENKNPILLELENVKAVNHQLYQNPVEQLPAELASPDSLEGVVHKAEFSIDDDNQLIPTRGIRELFEHYLSIYGEEPLETIIARIQAEISQELSEPAKSEAFELLKRYIDYKIALKEQADLFTVGSQSDGTYIQKLLESQQALISMRNTFFNSQESQEFFTHEDAQTAFLIEQIRINQDERLSIEEKSRLLEEAELLLPENIINSRESTQKYSELRENINIMIKDGASEEEVFQARKQILGTEAASALQQLDNDRNTWNTRLQHFSDARKGVLDSSLSRQDKITSIDQLLRSQFDALEQKRVRALIADGRFD